MDYGAFVELESGIEGLVHISEMSWTRKVAHPSKILQVGQQVESSCSTSIPDTAGSHSAQAGDGQSLGSGEGKISDRQHH